MRYWKCNKLTKLMYEPLRYLNGWKYKFTGFWKKIYVPHIYTGLVKKGILTLQLEMKLKKLEYCLKMLKLPKRPCKITKQKDWIEVQNTFIPIWKQIWRLNLLMDPTVDEAFDILFNSKKVWNLNIFSLFKSFLLHTIPLYVIRNEAICLQVL